MVDDGKLFSTPGRIAFPLAAAGALPVKLLGLEAAVAAAIARKFLRIATHQTLDQ